MSNIIAPPEHRLAPFKPAFFHIGIDHFGHLTVNMVGRGSRQQKRWICLFTCLVTRAVHLVVAYSMNVDDFLLCFSKFVSIRGRPVVYSDKGLNLQAGEKELKIADKEWNAENDIQAYATHRDIEWHFSPPHILVACGKEWCNQASEP